MVKEEVKSIAKEKEDLKSVFENQLKIVKEEYARELMECSRNHNQIEKSMANDINDLKHQLIQVKTDHQLSKSIICIYKLIVKLLTRSAY